jgi:hypothetical protein
MNTQDRKLIEKMGWCEVCGGSGWLRDAQRRGRAPCDTCHGTGKAKTEATAPEEFDGFKDFWEANTLLSTMSPHAAAKAAWLERGRKAESDNKRLRELAGEYRVAIESAASVRRAAQAIDDAQTKPHRGEVIAREEMDKIAEIATARITAALEGG